MPTANTPDDQAREVLITIDATPQGRRLLRDHGHKHVLLNAFQAEHGLSDELVEVALREWWYTHDGNFDFDLDEVKAICLRFLQTGTPATNRPE